MHGATRRGVLAGAAVALAGCSTDDSDGSGYGGGNGNDGSDADGADNPALAAAIDGGLSVSSPAFDDGATIPSKYGRGQADVNPPLELSGVPDDVASLALLVDDPDAVQVVGEIFVHWLVWNVPPDMTSIPEDWSVGSGVEGENDFGDVGYGGPAPPDEPHTYRFKCFALDTTLELDAGATVDELGPAMAGHILARGQLAGEYAPQ